MSDIMDDSVRCGNCGYVFHDDDIDKASGNRKPCPKCSSLKRHYYHKAEVKIGVKTEMLAVLKTPMDSQSWTILGLILAFVLPPTFLVVFSILKINFGYKLLVWFGIIVITFFLTRCFIFIKFLRWIVEKAYGKRTIS